MAYTITVTNSGQTAYTGRDAFTTADVLANAVYNANATATVRDRVLHQPEPDLDREPRRRRHGDHHLLGHGDSPDTGSGIMANTVTSPRRAATARRAAGTRLHRDGDRAIRPDDRQDRERERRGRAGGRLHGHGDQLRADAYTGATFTDPLTSVLANAVYNANAAATAGTCPTPART